MEVLICQDSKEAYELESVAKFFKKEVKDAVKQRGYPETLADAITFRAGVELPEDIGAIRTGLDTFAKKFPPQSEIPTEPVR